MSCNDRTRILHKWLWVDESLTKSPRETAIMWNSPELFLFQMNVEVTVFLSPDSWWPSLWYQTHKVPLFYCWMSISHDNQIGFVSVAATSDNKTEMTEVKSWEGFSKQASAGLFSGPIFQIWTTEPVHLTRWYSSRLISIIIPMMCLTYREVNSPSIGAEEEHLSGTCGHVCWWVMVSANT